MLYKRWPNMLCKRWFSVSKWKLGQRWALSCNFHWANVGCAMQNHQHFAHPKNVGPTCCTNVGPTCYTNIGPTCCINVGPTCYANVGSLLASGSSANVGLSAAIFIGPTLVGDAEPSALCSSEKRWPNMLDKRWFFVSKANKWNLGQRWTLTCKFHWANVGWRCRTISTLLI